MADSHESSGDLCPACGGPVVLAAVEPAGDVPCPHCRQLLWFVCRPIDDPPAVVLTFLPGLIAGSEGPGRIDQVAAAAGDRSQVVLNLAHLRFLSSLFLGMIMSLQKRLAAENRKLAVCGIEAAAKSVFQVTRLDSVLGVYADEQAALASFR